MNTPLEIGFPGQPVKTPTSTLISIVPWGITEHKPGLFPGHFFIPPSVDEEPMCLQITDSVHYVYIDKDRGSMRVVDPSYLVAKSIVADFNSAQMEASTGCHPGIFWRTGEYTTARVRNDLQEELAQIKTIQRRWFEAIVRVADDDWEKTRTHYAISDFQRIAARAIDPDNKRNRPWILSTAEVPETPETTLCRACGSDIPVGVAICRYCRFIVDPIKYATFQFAKNEGK
jgi:hypothetical protein